MKAIELTAPQLNAFRPVVLSDPKPARGEVLVRLHAGSLNFIDSAVAKGSYPVPGFPLVPVADGAGVIESVGEGVTTLVAGDRVVLHSKPHWVAGAIDARTAEVMRGISLPGSLAEKVVLRADGVVRTPEHLSDEAASTLPIAATTAWNALQVAKVRPGSTVLLLGTGVVSLFALQLAKARGARVIVTSSSKEKLERAKKLGADEGIDYAKTPDWENAVLSLTGKSGVDLVVETGGAETFGKSLVAAAHGGTVFTVGFLSGNEAKVDLFPIIKKALNVQGNNTGSVADLADAVRAIAAAKIDPIIDRTFAVSDVEKAYAFVNTSRKTFGKIVLTHPK